MGPEMDSGPVDPNAPRGRRKTMGLYSNEHELDLHHAEEAAQERRLNRADEQIAQMDDYHLSQLKAHSVWAEQAQGKLIALVIEAKVRLEAVRILRDDQILAVRSIERENDLERGDLSGKYDFDEFTDGLADMVRWLGGDETSDYSEPNCINAVQSLADLYHGTTKKMEA